MEIIINARGFTVDSSLRDSMKSHMEEILKKYFDHPFETHVNLSKERHMIVTEISSHVGKGIVLRSHCSHEDAFMSFSSASHKLELRLRRYKDRIRHHHHSHQESSDHLSHYVLPDDYGAEGEVPIIAENTEELPVLCVRDAVMRMDLSNLSVLVFKNAKHEKINVVHRRSDGTIGWIDPESRVRKISHS